MDTLEKILSASAELFTQYGFKTITMDDIARRAGISKKTLYQHFANKDEVVNESVIWHKNNMGASCATILTESENAIEAMVKILVFFDDMHKRINPMALFEMQRFYPQAYKTFRDMLVERDVVMMRDNILQGIKEGLYREDLNADLMARYRLETSMLILQPSLLVSDRNNLMSVALEIGEHFMYGLMTPKGEKLYQKYKEQYLKQAPRI
ncbi:MAG: transcriptional regulator, TetR family [Flavipsychrobacter sp.]|jgi:AcrR family transcriptional regulator|nr:transcriptional regulator, TetR family [Flavipsychrobacter sp.]